MRRHASAIVRPLSVASSESDLLPSGRYSVGGNGEVASCRPRRRPAVPSADRFSWVGRRRARSRRLNGRLLLRRTARPRNSRRRWMRRTWRLTIGRRCPVIGVVKCRFALLTSSSASGAVDSIITALKKSESWTSKEYHARQVVG